MHDLDPLADHGVLRASAARLVGRPPANFDVPCQTCGATVGDLCTWQIDRPDDMVHAARWDRAARFRAAHGLLVAALADAVLAEEAGRPATVELRRAVARHRTLRRHAERQGLPGFVLPSTAQVVAEAAQ